jgi:MarR-like DNA-binding transcriptional regulator SgrR of sgrS sRNA
MRRTSFLLVVISSALLTATAATRPHYGGTLHIAVHAAPMALDPAAGEQADWFGFSNISRLIFDTLVTLDNAGRPEPALAISWKSELGDQRWQFMLRSGVTFADGSTLTCSIADDSLRAANPVWKVFCSGEVLFIERDSPAPNLPAELALLRNCITKRNGSLLDSTGPFAIAQWNPGKKLILAAREDAWAGRAFVDSIEIDLGKSFREQAASFDLGKADLIEVAPEETRRAAAEGRLVQTSAPMELMALVFARERQSAEEAHLRQALSLSIDRGLLNNVVLQGAGEPTGSLLPNWMTGYGFLFSAAANMTPAQEERAQVAQAGVWTLSFDPSDAVERVIAERIVLNASEAGLRLQITAGNVADIHLVRIPLVSPDARTALAELAAALGLARPRAADSNESLFAAENALLQSGRVIPLLHLRSAFAARDIVMNSKEDRSGSWRLENVWLADKPFPRRPPMQSPQP